MTEFDNENIIAISLFTPSGCLGEGKNFDIRIQRSGAFEYTGKGNVEHWGEWKGAVNLIVFDSIASVISSSGFLELPANGESKTSIEYELVVAEHAGERSFKRDILDTPPIFWAIVRLTEMMIEKAEWGDKHYHQAIESFPAHLDGTYGKKRGYF